MLFVFVSHFADTYFTAGDVRAQWLQTITLIGSPAFMLISGVLIGCLARMRPDEFGRLRVLLADRGLFLLTLGRLLMMAGAWPHMQTTRYLMMTDVIGVSMILVPSIVAHVRAPVRMALGIGFIASSWLAMALWEPGSLAGQTFRETVFGSLSPQIYTRTLPLAPWIGLSLAASALGHRLGVLALEGDFTRMHRLLWRWGMATTAAGIVVKLGAPVVVATLSQATSNAALPFVDYLAAPGHKFPPSLAYLLFYGGLALVWVSLWLGMEHRDRTHWLLLRTAAVGRAALFMWIAQFYVYFTLISSLRDVLPMRYAWPLYLIVSIVVIVLPALWWQGRGWNRYFTVGLRALWMRQRQTATPRHAAVA